MNNLRVWSSSRTTWLLAGIVLLALALRVWGSGFGLPYEYHVDENQYVRQAATMGSNGLRPSDWFNPPFFKYTLLAEYGAYFVVGKVLGWFASSADFGQKLTTDPTWLYLLARWTSAFMGALTALVIYFTGKKAYHKWVGLAGAALYAVTFMPVREAHFAVNDAAATLWISLVLLAAVSLARTANWRWHLLGGAALGLGFATKYHSLAAALPLAVAHLYLWKECGFKLAFRRGLISLAAFFGAAVLASPYFLLNARDAAQNMYWLMWSGQYGFVGWEIDPSGGFVFYLKTFLWGMGWALALASLAALVAAAWRRRMADLILLSLPLFLYLFLGRQQMYFGRFMLPALPGLILVTCAWALELTGWLSRRLSARVTQGMLLTLVLTILAAQPLINSVQFDILLSRTDTRTTAKEWIEANIPDGAGVAMDWQFHCPQLATAERPVASSTRTYRTWTADFVMGKGLSDNPLSWYREQGYQYLVACSFIYDLPLQDPDANLKRKLFYATLDKEMTLVGEFWPNTGSYTPPLIFDELYGPAVSMSQRDRPGPVIKIYQFK